MMLIIKHLIVSAVDEKVADEKEHKKAIWT